MVKIRRLSTEGDSLTPRHGEGTAGEKFAVPVSLYLPAFHWGWPHRGKMPERLGVGKETPDIRYLLLEIKTRVV